MKKYHRLQILITSYKQRRIGNFALISGKLIREKMLGQNRLIFGLYIDDNDVKLHEDFDGDFKVRQIVSIDDMTPDIWSELRSNSNSISHYITSNVDVRLHSGYRLWLGYSNENLACILWSVPGDKQDAYFFPLTSQCILIGHCVTLPQYRGKGFFTKGLTHVIRSLAAEHRHRFYIDCSDWNIASRKGIERAGFKLIGRGKCRRKDRLIWYQEKTPDVARLFIENE